MGWMTSSGVSMHYEVSGRGQRSLILVHELGGTLDSWDAVLPLLEPEFRVLRFDQRGSGLSEKVRKAFNVEDHVQDLQNILEVVELPPPYYLAGMAAGAAVVLGFVHRRGAEAAAVVLCAAATDVGPGPAAISAGSRRAGLPRRNARSRGYDARAFFPPSRAPRSGGV